GRVGSNPTGGIASRNNLGNSRSAMRWFIKHHLLHWVAALTVVSCDRDTSQPTTPTAATAVSSDSTAQAAKPLSQDPAASFKAFVDRFVAELKWEPIKDETFQMEITTAIDVRKTDSLISPFMGTLILTRK